MSVRRKKEEETYKKFQEEQERQMLLAIENDRPCLPRDEELDGKVDAMIAAGPKTTRESRVNTIKARSAAAALSDSSSTAPSAATKATQSSMQKRRKPAFTVLGAKTTSNMASAPSRNAPLPVSKNTIGFPKAKKAPSIVPNNERVKAKTTIQQQPKIDQSKVHPEDFKNLYGEPPVESDMWFRLREHESLEESIKEDEADELADNLFDTDFYPTGGEIEEEELFQLAMPE